MTPDRKTVFVDSEQEKDYRVKTDELSKQIEKDIGQGRLDLILKILSMYGPERITHSPFVPVIGSKM